MSINRYFSTLFIIYHFINPNLSFAFDWKTDQCETESGFQINTDPPNKAIGHTSLDQSRSRDQKATDTCFAHTATTLFEEHLKQEEPTQNFNLSVTSVLAGNGSIDTKTGGMVFAVLHRLKKSKYPIRNEYEEEPHIEEIGSVIGCKCTRPNPIKAIEIIPKTIRDVDKILTSVIPSAELHKAKINNLSYDFNIHTMSPKKYKEPMINQYILEHIPVGIGLDKHAVTITGAATVCCKDKCEEKFLIRNSWGASQSGWMSASKLLKALAKNGSEITYIKKCQPDLPTQDTTEACTAELISDRPLTTLVLAHDRTGFHTLLRKSKKDLSSNPHEGIEALEAAIVHDKHFAVKKLSLIDMDINSHSRSGSNPLHVAITHKKKGALQTLLAHQKIDVNARNKADQSPMELAIMMNNLDALQALLAHPNINVNARNSADQTPLENALLSGNTEVVHMLLAHPKIDVNSRNTSGYTLLEIAALTNNKNLEALLSHPNIEVNSIHPTYHMTPLHLAMIKQKTQSIETLLRSNKVDVNIPIATNGTTPLNIATKMGDLHTLQKLLLHPNIRLTNTMAKHQTLLEYALNLAPNTPHIDETIQLLFKNEVLRKTITDKNATEYRQQLLESAIKNKNTSAVKSLLSMGADPTAPTLDGRTLIDTTDDPTLKELLNSAVQPQLNPTGREP